MHVRDLEALYERARRGDHRARGVLLVLDERARVGDSRAEQVKNALAIIHYARGNPGAWAACNRLYKGLAGGERSSQEQAARVKVLASQGDARARRVFSMLRTIHNHHKATLSPETAGFNMRVRRHFAHTGSLEGLASTQLRRVAPLTPEAALKLMNLMQTALLSKPKREYTAETIASTTIDAARLQQGSRAAAALTQQYISALGTRR